MEDVFHLFLLLISLLLTSIFIDQDHDSCSCSPSWCSWVSTPSIVFRIAPFCSYYYLLRGLIFLKEFLLFQRCLLVCFEIHHCLLQLLIVEKGKNNIFWSEFYPTVSIPHYDFNC